MINHINETGSKDLTAKSSKYLILFSAFFLAIGSVSAQNVQVDGLEFEEVQPNFNDENINFQTSYLDKNITYAELLVP
ncbi:MAG: hypothetical protein V5A72_03200, partial [Candidatus Nanohaloarchaea archaeon]